MVPGVFGRITALLLLMVASRPARGLEGCELALASQRFPDLGKTANFGPGVDKQLDPRFTWTLRVPVGYQASLYLQQVPPTHLMNLFEIGVVSPNGRGSEFRARFVANTLGPNASWGPIRAADKDIYLLLTAWHTEAANPPSSPFHSLEPAMTTIGVPVPVPPFPPTHEGASGLYFQSALKITGLDLLGADDSGDTNGPDWDDFATKIGCAKIP